MNAQEIGAELERVENLINEKTLELSTLREAYQIAKAMFENTFSRYLLETKAKNPDWTVQEVKAQAVNLAYVDKLEKIKKESSYQKANNELEALYTQHDGVKEMSYNLRQEMNRL